MAPWEGFDGVPVDAYAFYRELAEDNSKAWWEQHKARYLANVREPMTELGELLAPRYGEPQVFRPHRDVRFSADKAPYKEHQGVFVRTSQTIGWYVQVSAAGLLTAGGGYHFAPDQLARYRQAVDESLTGRPLVRIVEGLRAKGFAIRGDLLATRPRGIDPDHPRLELLRHKSLTAGRDHGTVAWIASAELPRQIDADWTATRDLVQWLTDHVGPSEETERRRR